MTQLRVQQSQKICVDTQEEYNELQEKEKPIWWSMQDLIDETGVRVQMVARQYSHVIRSILSSFSILYIIQMVANGLLIENECRSF